MELQLGLKFKKYYNDNNPNNVNYCEVRGIVDDCQIVLYCKKQETTINDKIEYYEMISIFNFEFHVKNDVFQKLDWVVYNEQDY